MRVLYKGFLIKGFKTFLEMGQKYNLSEEELYRLRVMDFYINKSGKNITKTANHFCIDRNTIYRWLKQFDKNNLKSLEPKSTKPIHTYRKNKIDLNTENKVLKIKRKYPYYGKEKIKEILKREYNIKISSSSIGRIIKKHKLTYIWRKQETACKFKKIVKKRKTNKQRLKDYLNHKNIFKVGQVIQIDTVRIMYNGSNIYVINAIDVYSKLAISYAYKSPSSKNAKDFLENIECLEKIDAIRGIDVVNEKIKRYLIEYNSFRPHQALNYLIPLDVYIKCLTSNINPSFLNEKLHHMLWTSPSFLKKFVIIINFNIIYLLFLWCHGRVVMQGSATPRIGVQFSLAPPIKKN